MSVFDCTQVGEVHKRIWTWRGVTGALCTSNCPRTEQFAQVKWHSCECTLARNTGSMVQTINTRNGTTLVGPLLGNRTALVC